MHSTTTKARAGRTRLSHDLHGYTFGGAGVVPVLVSLGLMLGASYEGWLMATGPDGKTQWETFVAFPGAFSLIGFPLLWVAATLAFAGIVVDSGRRIGIATLAFAVLVGIPQSYFFVETTRSVFLELSTGMR